MKTAFLFFIVIVMFLTSCVEKTNDKSDSQIIENKQIIKKDAKYALEEQRVEYRTTAYDSRLLPDPDSNSELIRVPKNTRLKVLEKRTVQQGRIQNNWYKVIYKGKTGWISGWNMKEGEELIITSVEEMERNYSKQVGDKPQNDPLTGKIDVVAKWLNKNAYEPKSIEYIQWYEAYYSSGCWNCRVEFRTKNKLGNITKEDKIFRIKNGSVTQVIDKN